MKEDIPDPAELPPMAQVELDDIMRLHTMYLRGQRGGARAVIKYKNLSHLHFKSHDLSQADFTGSIFVESDLSYGTFSGCCFFACDLRNANLGYADFTRSDFRGAYVAGADLTEANMHEVDMREGKIMLRDEDSGLADRKRSGGKEAKTVFSGAKLKRTNMRGAQAQAVDFSDADVSEVELTRANLSGTNFHGANLTNTDFSGSNLTEANLRSSIVTGVTLENVETQGMITKGIVTEDDMGAQIENLGKTLPELLEEHSHWVESAGSDGRQLDLSGYDMRPIDRLRLFPLTAIKAIGANFLSQDLTGAELQSAVFDRSDFRDCKMMHADLRGSTFKYAQMARTNLTNAKLCPLSFDNDGNKRLQRTDLSGAGLRYSILRNADLRDCVLMGADLTNAVLAGCDLRRADLTGAILQGATFTNCNLEGTLIDTDGF